MYMISHFIGQMSKLTTQGELNPDLPLAASGGGGRGRAGTCGWGQAWKTRRRSGGLRGGQEDRLGDDVGGDPWIQTMSHTQK